MHRALAVILVQSLTLATALVGCTADPNEAGGILVLKNVAAGMGCVTSAAETETGISHGSLDVVFPTDYLFIAQMRSRITALVGQESQRTIITSGARVDITFPGSTLFNDTELAELRTGGLTHFRTLFTAPIAPNSGVTDAGFTLVPAALAARILQKSNAVPGFRVQMVATFTVEGDMSGESVESQEFSYPITAGVNSSVGLIGDCSAIEDSDVKNPGYSCNPFQDGIVDCCSSGNTTVCPARNI